MCVCNRQAAPQAEKGPFYSAPVLTPAGAERRHQRSRGHFSGERVQRVHVCRFPTGTSCQPSVAARSAYLVGREENLLSYPTFRYSKQRSLLFRRKLLDRWCAKAPRRGQGHVVRRSYKYDHGQQLPYILQDRDPTIAQAWIRGPTPPRPPPRCWAQELQVTKFLS